MQARYNYHCVITAAICAKLHVCIHSLLGVEGMWVLPACEMYKIQNRMSLQYPCKTYAPWKNDAEVLERQNSASMV